MNNFIIKNYGWALSVLFVYLFLIIAKIYSYLLFHTLAEIFSVIVAALIFIITWHSRKHISYNFYIFIGISYLFIGIIDIFHLLAFPGMNIFSGYDSNLPTQLHILGRYYESLALFIAPLLAIKKFPAKTYLVLGGLATAAILSLIFKGYFPLALIADQGLTNFKIFSEYIIVAICAATLLVLWNKREKFSESVLLMLMGSTSFLIMAELSFTLYSDPYGTFNFLGHIFRIASYMLIYGAVIANSLYKPQKTLYYDLQKSEKKYQDLFSHMTSAFALHKVIFNSQKEPIDYEFIEANPAFGKMTGLSVDEIIGKKATEVIKHDPQKWIKLYGNVALQQKEEEFEEYFPEYNKWFSINAYCPMPGYFALLFDDTTERKKIEINLQESRAMYRILSETSPDCIKLFDVNGKLQYINRSGLKEHGLSSIEEAKNWDYISSVVEADRSLFRQAISDAAKGKMSRIEIRHTEEGADREVCLETVVPIRDHNNNVVNILGFSRDIGDEKKANQAKTEFIAMASHQIRTPLTNIGFSLEALEENFAGELNPEQMRYVSDAREDVEQMKELISRLLNISRIEAGTYMKRPQTTNLENLISEICAGFELFARKSQVELIKDIDKSAPEFIEIDKEILKNILQNLVSNAIKYTPPGGKVHVNVEAGSPQLIFSVKDTGSGIPEKAQPLIFTKMYKAYDLLDTREKKSSGLGLYIAKVLTQNLGGRIWFETKAGEGTVFSVSIPFKASKKIELAYSSRGSIKT
jgi:PAS domain S-box-containing protein